MKVVGYEAANSFVKIKSEKGETAYLNSLRERIEPVEDVYGGTFGNKSSLNFYKYDDVTYTAGDIYDAKSSSARDSDRYGTYEYKVESLIAIAQHIDNGDEVKVVTGLPAKDYKKQECHDKLSKNLRGTHTVYIGKEPRTFEIKEVKTILQPLGTLTALMFNDDGTPKEQGLKLSRQRVVVVDIGFGTTDVAVLEGGNLIDSFGVDVAMFDAYDRILKKVGLENDLTTFQMESYVRKAIKDNRKVTFEYGGVEYDVTDETKKSLQITAGSIVSGVKNRIALDKFDATVFTGGGVLALRSNLKHQLEDVPNAVPVGSPQMANARGNYIYGVVKR
jgi:plasmid segregation protein ParM